MSASENAINKQNISPVIEVVALALRNSNDGKYLLARRGPGGAGAGHWEFPGGKIEPGETQQVALRREIIEELGFDLSSQPLAFVAENDHVYGARKFRIYLWRAEVNYRPEFRLLDHDLIEWMTVSRIKEINLSEADKYFISLI